MNLKQLAEAVERLRAIGTHPLTEVVIQDGTSRIGVERIDVENGRISIEPEYTVEQSNPSVEDDE